MAKKTTKKSAKTSELSWWKERKKILSKNTKPAVK
jgi:hypothetical protein